MMNWNLNKAFPMERLRREMTKNGVDDQVRAAFLDDKGSNRRCDRTVKALERNPGQICDTIAMRFADSVDGVASFDANLHVVSFSGTYAETLSMFSSHTGEKESTQSSTKRYVICGYAVSIRDLLKMYHYTAPTVFSAENKHQGGVSSCDTDKTVDCVAWRPDAAQFAKKKTALIRAALLGDNDNANARIIGRVYQSNICRIVANNLCTSDRESFLASKVIFGFSIAPQRDYDRKKRCWVQLSLREQQERFGRKLLETACAVADILVDHFCFGKPLYAQVEEAIEFEQPISMLEFFSLIDENECRIKAKAGHYIFKKCNAREQELLDKQTEMTIMDPEEIPDEIPVFLYRKFRFTRFSQSLARSLCYSALYAVRVWSVPKRWRNQKRRCVREQWRRKHKVADPYYKKTSKECDQKTMVQEGLDIVYGEPMDTESQCVEQDEPDDGDHFCDLKDSDSLRGAETDCAMPRSIVASDNDIDAEMCCFLTDEEVLHRCVEIDESDTMLLEDKLQHLNRLAYSRMLPEETGYLLLAPDEDLPSFEDSSERSVPIAYRTFFVPCLDLRLPKIVLIADFCRRSDQ